MAALIASGELRRCVQASALASLQLPPSASSSSSTAEPLTDTSCKDVIVVTLTIPSDKVQATESLTATVDRVSDPAISGQKVRRTKTFHFLSPAPTGHHRRSG